MAKRTPLALNEELLTLDDKIDKLNIVDTPPDEREIKSGADIIAYKDRLKKQRDELVQKRTTIRHQLYEEQPLDQLASKLRELKQHLAGLTERQLSEQSGPDLKLIANDLHRVANDQPGPGPNPAIGLVLLELSNKIQRLEEETNDLKVFVEAAYKNKGKYRRILVSVLRIIAGILGLLVAITILYIKFK